MFEVKGDIKGEGVLMEHGHLVESFANCVNWLEGTQGREDAEEAAGGEVWVWVGVECSEE